MIPWLLFVSLQAAAPPGPGDRFSDVEIEKPFEEYLAASPVLMETPGTRVIHLDGGRQVLLAVASTPLRNDSPGERLRAETVCHARALAEVVALKQGVQVYHVQKIEERTVLVQEGENESARAVSELLQETRITVEGRVRDLPVVGRWRSRRGDLFYLALGAILDGRGTPTPTAIPK